MIPYFIAFIITNILVIIGENLYKTRKKASIIVLVIAMIPIILLCGLRTIEMGWDTKKYLVSIYNHICNSDLSSFIAYMNFRDTEKGFTILVYLLTKLNSNINFVLIGLNAIVTYSVLYFAIKLKEKNNNSIIFTIFLYETTLYSITFSTLRQCISLAITFIICIKHYENKKICCIFLIILSFLFHSSSFMIIILLFLISINDSKKIPRKYKFLVNILLIACITFSVMFYDNILIFFGKLGIMPDRYVDYLDTKYNSENLVVRWQFLIFKLFNLIIGILYFQSKTVSTKEKNENTKWFIMIVIDFIITLFSMKVLNAHRLTYYLFYPSLFLFIPQTLKIFKNNRTNKLLSALLFFIVYILYYVTSLGYYSILPYRGIF